MSKEKAFCQIHRWRQHDGDGQNSCDTRSASGALKARGFVDRRRASQKHAGSGNPMIAPSPSSPNAN
jgi:hypothetical protein